ncbi:MAG: methylated-DNA--[protein]-cysteine S-methyltransferase [Pseudomonadota bacterium]|nr:methylated-DNA--[protein]-cysteine S-methyltransferase [Pseudomonadota bacterium]MEC8104280.1 methylated-DNA--[protein]-cysteine S-methyltransferase [Pseudomonadota bacterium]
MPGKYIPSLDVAFGLSSYGVIATAVCEGELFAVLPGGCRTELLDELLHLFPNITMSSEKRAAHALSDVLQSIESPRRTLKTPLHMIGTEFQCKVWEYLLTIPIGETRTYAQVAEGIGKPEAVRAVANACGTNKLAILVPCHRVVRSDGSLGGYCWGTELKERLLARERELTSGDALYDVDKSTPRYQNILC